MLARNIYGFGKRFEKRLHNVMRFIPIKQLQMEVAAGLICEPLEELPGQPKSKR